ncbi:enoyl-CoA hydratase/isomerase family protein [Streptomyces sp. NPDC090075]|uniref:enoyl-CoA hydratase/isomerase family protein n=1 Tax=Streptomyces sp. NPDC090075 TaxID=3365937 RepID=UPI0038271FC9
MAERQLGDVSIRLAHGVAELTLAPSGPGTVDRVTATELTAFLRGAQAEGVRSILITGSGRHFCVGADMAQESTRRTDSTLDYRTVYEPFAELFEALWAIETPVVTAVNGSVGGVGWLLALLGDIVVADSRARWTHVFTRAGMVPHAGDPYFLTRLVPYRRLAEIALLSDSITSATLESWNVISRSVPTEELMPTARDFAERLAAGPTRSLGLAKQLYRRAMDSSLAHSAAEERASVALNSTTEDRAEGLASLLERRAPKFVGR